MVTAATYHKEKLFNSAEKLDIVQDMLLKLFEEFNWEPKAWAIFANHYHFVAFQEGTDTNLMAMIAKLHSRSSAALNALDGQQGRKVWYRSWPTKLTYERSYFSRVAYVHQNPVRHGVVQNAIDYNWCSAAWFERRADPTHFKTVYSFAYDKINLDDDY